MAKSESKAARQAYKRAIVDCLQAIQTLNPEGDAGVTFWRDELERVLSRQVGKLAGVELPEVKVARHAGDVALAKVTAERDALAARLASLGKGERAKVREARGEASEAWDRLATVTIAAVDDCNPDPEEPWFDDCHVAGDWLDALSADITANREADRNIAPIRQGVRHAN